ncbi:uncharacterized protein LOC143572729 [Bidens hawaiensis]|uniref:uncharacterized protein LOC143572729 n=1 Tax=Bidens hawaiensis TaxID=980011 RepID=UPI00404B8684
MTTRPRVNGTNPVQPRRAIAGRVYEKFKPIYEWRPEDHHDSLLVYLPVIKLQVYKGPSFDTYNQNFSDPTPFVFVGFPKKFMKVTTENPNILRVHGERLVPGNKWHWFHEDFKVPETCEMSKIRAKYEGGIITITMPHKIINPPTTTTIQEPMKTEKHDTDSTMPSSSTLAATSNETKNGRMPLNALVGTSEDKKSVTKMRMVVAAVVAVALVAVGVYFSNSVGNYV